MKRWFFTILLMPLAALRPSVAIAAPADTQKIDVQELVKQAVINFNTREALPRDYTYVERVKADHPGQAGGRSEDTYEVIEIKGHAFRRHTMHNANKIVDEPDHAQDEGYLEKWREVEHKLLEEEIKPGRTPQSLAAAVQKIMEEAGLKDWKPQLATPPTASSMGVVLFPQSLYTFRLPLGNLAQEFNLTSKGEQLLKGRKAYVIQADPRRSGDKASPTANFKIKVWIDQAELQIVKAEGKALRAGPLSQASYSAFSSTSRLSQKDIDESKQQLAESQLYYGEGTTVVQEWTKVNDEVWLLQRCHAKGSHIFVVKGEVRFAGANHPRPVEYETVDTNYRKFRVQHRILPAGPDH
ncbi:MAG TPA: hypothetical protein VIB39_20625 [Candidatus Angelobacter sp.]